jgi:molecular chaperone HtpG
MKEGQDAIYYIAGDNRDVLIASPHLEAFTERGIEVLLLTDPVDEIWTTSGVEFQGKALRSVARADVSVAGDAEKGEEHAKREELSREFADLLSSLQARLDDRVREVRLSSRLKTSPVVLVTGEHDLSPQMAKIFKAMGQEAPASKRVMELNPDHPIAQRLLETHRKDPNDPLIGDYAELLFGQAMLSEGAIPDDPSRLSRLIAELMTKAH